MLSEESEKISLENRFKETIKKANKVKEYIREKDKERGYSSEPSIAECLAYDMKYVEEYISKLQKENKEIKHDNKILIDEEKNYIHTEQVHNNQIQQLKKQIDLMTEEIRKTILIVKPESKFCQYEEDCKNIRCKDCIKQYFEKQAKENEGNNDNN